MDITVELDCDEVVIRFGHDHGIRLEDWIARRLRNELRTFFGEGEEDEGEEDEDLQEVLNGEVFLDFLEEDDGPVVQVILSGGNSWYDLRWEEAERLWEGLERIPLPSPCQQKATVPEYQPHKSSYAEATKTTMDWLSKRGADNGKEAK